MADLDDILPRLGVHSFQSSLPTRQALELPGELFAKTEFSEGYGHTLLRELQVGLGRSFDAFRLPSGMTRALSQQVEGLSDLAGINVAEFGAAFLSWQQGDHAAAIKAVVELTEDALKLAGAAATNVPLLNIITGVVVFLIDVGQWLYRGIREIRRGQRGPPMVYDHAEDSRAANVILNAGMRADYTNVFLPVRWQHGTQAAGFRDSDIRRYRVEWTNGKTGQLLAVGDGIPIEESGAAESGRQGFVPETMQFARSYQWQDAGRDSFWKGYNAVGDRFPFGWEVYHPAQQLACWLLWQRIRRPGVDAFRVDTTKMSYEWGEYFRPFEEYANAEGRFPSSLRGVVAGLLRPSWWARVDSRGRSTVPNVPSKYYSRVLWRDGHVLTARGLVQYWCDQHFERQKRYLGTLACAYLDGSEPAFSSGDGRGEQLRRLWVQRRQELLRHPARYRVELDKVPIFQYRNHLFQSRLSLTGQERGAAERIPITVLFPSIEPGADDPPPPPGGMGETSGAGRAAVTAAVALALLRLF